MKLEGKLLDMTVLELWYGIMADTYCYPRDWDLDITGRNIIKVATLCAAESLAKRGHDWPTARELSDCAGLDLPRARRSLSVLLSRWSDGWPAPWQLFSRVLEHDEYGILHGVKWGGPGDGRYRYKLTPHGRRWLKERLPRIEARLGYPDGSFRQYVAEEVDEWMDAKAGAR